MANMLGKRKRLINTPRRIKAKTYSKVGRQPTTELKGTYTGFANGLTTAGTVTLLNAIAAGDDLQERNGRAIKLKYMDVILSLQMNLATLTARQSFFRYMFIYDSAPNGVLAIPGDILVTPVSNYSPVRIDTNSRFKVLADVVGTVAGVMPTDVAGSTYTRKHRINLKNMASYFTSSVSGIGSIREGAILILAIGESVNTTITLNSQVYFTDV